MKIKKYQTGGYMTFQSIGFMPEQQQSTEDKTQKQEKAQKEQISILDKDIIKEIAGNGITNDVVEFTNTVNSAYSKYMGLSDVQKNTSYGRSLRNVIQGDLSQLNELKRNSEAFKEAVGIVKSNDANNEIATTNNGVIVKNYDTGEISEVSFNDYAKIIKSDKKIRAITNSQLINEREYNRNLAFREEPIEILRNSTSIKKVKEEVWEILKYIGTTSKKKTGNELVDSTNEGVANALKTITTMSRDGVYDISKMESKETNSEQLKMAAESMWQNLSESARNVLMARAAARGSENIVKSAQEDMVSLLSPYSTVKTDKADKMEFKGDTGDGSGKGTQEIGYWQSMANRHGALENVKLNIGNNIDYNILAATFPAFMDESGKSYGTTSVSKISQLSSIADINSVTFGDQHVDPANLDALVYTGDKVREYSLPYTEVLDDAGRSTGRVKPDFDTLDKIDKAQKDLAKYGKSANAIVKQSVYAKYGIPTDQKGNPAVKEKTFVVFDAYGHSNMGIDEDSKYLINQTDVEGVKDLYEGAYLYNNREKTSRNKIDRGSYEGMFGNKDILKSQVFIPLSATSDIGALLDKSGVKVQAPQRQGYNQVISDQRQYDNKNISRYNLSNYGN